MLRAKGKSRFENLLRDADIDILEVADGTASEASLPDRLSKLAGSASPDGLI